MSGPVLVTGASGFIGAHTAAALLERGHDVRATVSGEHRIPDVRTALGGLVDGGADVEVVVANLEDPDAWTVPTAGCSDIVHLASPLPVEQPKDANELIGPARDGALRVLAAAREAGVRRVVMTSSEAAIAGSKSDTPERVYTEEDWTDLDVPGVSPYNQSKTIAERAARDDVEANGGPQFVTVNPGLVLGPVARPEVNASIEVVYRLLAGKVPMIPNVGFDVVDVRDVADLHVLALEHDDADGGRFPATSEFMWFTDIAAVMRDELGDRARKVPSRKAPDLLVRALALVDGGIRTILPELGQHRTLSSQTSIDRLGWTPRPAREAVVDCAESLLAHDLV